MKDAAKGKSPSGFSTWPIAERTVHRQVIAHSCNSGSTRSPGCVIRVPSVPINPQPMYACFWVLAETNILIRFISSALQIYFLASWINNMEISPYLYQALKNTVTVYIYNALSSLWKKAGPLFLWRLQNTGTRISYTSWVSICMTSSFCDNRCCCCSLLRNCAIKMNDDDGFQSAGRAESCIAAQRWRPQEGIVLVWHARAYAALWSCQLKQCHSSAWCEQKRHFVPSLPLPPPDSSQSRSKHLVVHHRRQGFEEWKARMAGGRWEHCRKEFDQGTRNRSGKQDLVRVQAQSSLKIQWMQPFLITFQFLGTRPTHLDWGQKRKKKVRIFWVEKTLNYSNQL